MHSSAQLASIVSFGSISVRMFATIRRMPEHILRAVTVAHRSFSLRRFLGRSALLCLLLLAMMTVGVVSCGGGAGDDSVIAQAGSGTLPPATPGGGSTPVHAAAPTNFTLKVDKLNTSLSSPWGLAFLPDGRMLVTEKGGTLKLLSAAGATVATISGVPAVNSSGQGGLLDVVIDPAHSSNQRIYLSYAENDATNSSLSGTAVARAKLNVAANRLDDLTVIFRQSPKVASSGHFGSRLVFDANGYLFVALGDRQSSGQRGFSQDLTRGNGKVMRITTEGLPAPGNPSWSGVAGAQSHIWSYGHRNPQGAALDSKGQLWVSEHGPQGGDEINLAQAGKNYGWPVISHGQEYGTLTPVGEGTAKAGMEQPVSVWLTRDGSAYTGGSKSSMAPAGLVVYSGNKFPEYSGNLLSGALAGTALWRVALGADGKTEVFRERLLASRAERIRDVRQGPDGWIYLLTDNGKLLRVSR
ncbi:MAG: PQQ-dependent sugar dehydrogenase [Brachymonas sp.]